MFLFSHVTCCITVQPHGEDGRPGPREAFSGLTPGIRNGLQRVEVHVSWGQGKEIVCFFSLLLHGHTEPVAPAERSLRLPAFNSIKAPEQHGVKHLNECLSMNLNVCFRAWLIMGSLKNN